MNVKFALSTGALLLMMALAGCSGSKDGEATGDGGPDSNVVAPGDRRPDAATILGVVLDDSALPIQGAQAGVVEADLVATTGADGRFVFDNLAPGKHTLIVQRLGFDTQAQKVVLEANQELRVTITLLSLAVNEPRYEIKGPHQGLIACSMSTTGAPILLGASAGGCNYYGVFGQSNNTMRFKLSQEDIKAAVGEMQWDPSAYATSSRLQSTFSYTGRTSTHWWCSGASTTPVRWVYNTDANLKSCSTTGSASAEPVPRMDLELIVFANMDFVSATSTSNPRPADIAIQQHYDTYVTLFYGMDPPEDWTAFPDA
jgi:hypothetical protein